MNPYKAVNWNAQENDYAGMFREQNLRQFWVDTEYIPSKNIDSWKSLSPEIQQTYKKSVGRVNFAGYTAKPYWYAQTA